MAAMLLGRPNHVVMSGIQGEELVGGLHLTKGPSLYVVEPTGLLEEGLAHSKAICDLREGHVEALFQFILGDQPYGGRHCLFANR